MYGAGQSGDTALSVCGIGNHEREEEEENTNYEPVNWNESIISNISLFGILVYEIKE